MEDILQQAIYYLTHIDPYEAAGLVFGLLSVLFLIRENILTWPSGIIYVLVSFVIFWREKLYADFALHVFFLVLNVYGWWYWIYGSKKDEEEVPVTFTEPKLLLGLTLLSTAGVFVMGYFLTRYTDASLPYWDSATTVFSLTGMWLTARKKLENWYFWFLVDVLATGVYFYKEIYFYSILYFIYIGLAVSGYLAWRKTMHIQTTS